MDRLLTPKEIRPFLRDTSVMINDMLKAQDAKTHKADMEAVGEWLESKMFAFPLSGIDWHIRLDQVETLKRGEMPE